MAESLVDTFKTELISDRVWRTRAQLEVAIARWVGWYNSQRLHSALGDLPPVEFETARELEQILQLRVPLIAADRPFGPLTALAAAVEQRASQGHDRSIDQRTTTVTTMPQSGL